MSLLTIADLSSSLKRSVLQSTPEETEAEVKRLKGIVLAMSRILVKVSTFFRFFPPQLTPFSTKLLRSSVSDSKEIAVSQTCVLTGVVRNPTTSLCTRRAPSWPFTITRSFS